MALAAPLLIQVPDLSPEELLRNIAAKRFTGKPVTLQVTADNLKSAIEVIQKISGLSIEVDPAIYELARRTSSDRSVILANQMPWDALLEAILGEFRLGITIEGERLVIRSPGRDMQAINSPLQEAHSSAWTWVLPALLLLAVGTGGILIAKKKAARNRSRTKFALDPGPAEEIKTKILYLFEVEKIHREEDLSLQRLSARISAPAHHVSWIVNELLGLSFSRLVNTYRVDEVKKRLGDPRDSGRTILDIAFEAGFNTKTAFNKVFKKQTGMTPSEFRQKALG
jgi:AraC-like DNA-binding protein